MEQSSSHDWRSPDFIARILADHAADTSPSEQARRRAAVALILSPSAPDLKFLEPRPEGDGLCVLVIKRAEHPLDPWSGHMAFPGGHQDPTDPDLEFAARRETLEEVGLDLSAATRIGRLHDLAGGRLRQSGLTVSPYVFYCPSIPPLTLSSEVADAVWVPLAYLAEPGNIRPYVYPPDPLARTFPSYPLAPRYTIWGMTYRMIGDFFSLFGIHIPNEDEMTEVE